MTAATASVEQAPGGERTEVEVEVAADAICALFEAGLLPRSAAPVAAQAAGVTLGDIHQAALRRDRHLYVPPSRHRNAAGSPVPKRHDDWPPESRQRWQDGVERGREHAARAKTRQPRRGQRTLICAACGNDLTLDRFELRPDRPGKRRTTCITCRREASRDRYLSVAKQQALNTARLTFVISGNDQSLGLACIDCGELFKPGDEVTGAAQLAHTTCREAQQ